MNNDQLNGSISLKAGFFNFKYVTVISEINKMVDLTGWNHFVMQIDSYQNLRIAINSEQQVNINLGNNGLIDIQQYSSECWLGGGDIGGLYLRHLVFAGGKSNSMSDYIDYYGHSIPAPLDPYVLGYYPLQDSEEARLNFQTQFFINTGSWNEPDIICHCVGSEDLETANYPHLGNSADKIFDPIPSVPYPSLANFSLRVSFQLNMQMISIGRSQNQDILSHQGLWTLGSYSDQQIYAKINGISEPIQFDVSTDPRFSRRQLIFKNQWINYTFGFDLNSAYLIVDDFTQKTPLILTYYFTSPLTMTSFEQQQSQGSFVLHPQGLSGLFSGLSYYLNGEQQFNFKFSQDNFIYTSEPNGIFLDKQYRKNYQTRVLYGQYVSGNRVIKASNGLLFQQSIGACNQSEVRYKWDGVACHDLKRYFALNQKSSQVIMESYLRSTSSRYTFETWFKFQGQAKTGQDRSSIMTVYDPYTPQNMQLQVSIVSSDSSSAFTIKCDPNANFDFKSILEPVYVKNLVKPNFWMHYSCVSDAYVKQLHGYLYDQESQNTYHSVQNGSNTIQGIQTITLRTVFGNDGQGTSPFKGFLREIRFWNVVRSDLEIDQFRYQTIPYASDLRSSMIAYLMLNQGTGNQYVEFDIYQQLSSQHIYEQLIDNADKNMNLVSSVTWLKDTAIEGSLTLRICPPGTVFSQNCCVKSDFSIKVKKTLTVNDTASVSYIQLDLVITENFTVNQPINQYHYTHEWSIVNVSNYSANWTVTAGHLKTIEDKIKLQQDDPQRQLQLAQDTLAINATYTFKVLVKSAIRNYDRVKEAIVVVRPECPQIRLSPKINNNVPLRISKMMDPSLLNFTLDIKGNCVDPQINITSIDWTVSTPQFTFILSEDKKNLKFKEFLGKLIFVTVKVSFHNLNEPQGNIQRVSDQVSIQIIDEPFQLVLNNLGDKLDAKKNDLIFDPSYTDIKVNFPLSEQDRGLEYIIDCPPYMFSSDSHMKRLCKPDPITGFLRIKPDETAYINYQEYNFTYTVRSDILGYFQSKTVAIIFYSEQYFNCPKIFFGPRTDYSRRDQYYLIKPFIQLDCQKENNTPNTIVERFQLQKIEWQVEDFVNPRDFLDIYGLVAMVKKSKMEQILTPNYAKNITLIVTLSNGTVIRTQTRFSILRSQLKIDIQNSHNGTSVPFNETMVLDVSKSQDTDYTQDELSIKWTIKEGQYTQVNVKQLIITPFDRLTMNLMDVPQKITVDLTNLQQSDLISAQKSIWINFLSHLTAEKYSPIIAAKNCQIRLENTPDSYQFNKVNMSDFWISGSINQTSCFPSILVEKAAFYTYLPLKLMNENITSQYVQSQQIKIRTEELNKMVAGETLKVDLIFLVSFMETITSKTKYDYIVRSVKLTRVQSPLEVVFKGIANKSIEIEVGQESSITIDASETFDIDNPIGFKNYTYIWICPSLMYCPGRSSHLTITRDMRVERNLNSIGAIFKVGVQVKSQGKESPISYLSLRVVKQDYNKCLVARLQGAEENLLKIYKDQQFPLKLNLKPDYICANVSIKSVDWIPQQGTSKFWTVSDKYQQQISIQSASVLPLQTNEISIQAQMMYDVYNFENQVIKQQLSQVFTLQVINPKIQINIKTNQRDHSIYQISNETQLILDASDSFDPEYPDQKLTCKWICPQDVCGSTSYESTCIINVTQMKINGRSEITEFKVQVISQDQKKSEIKSIMITHISRELVEKLPLCGIKQIHEREIFDLERQMIFIPNCFAALRNQKFDANYDFSWELTPDLTTVVKSNKKLTIPSLSLYSSLSNKYAGNLTITLKVTNKNDSSTSYKVSKTYDIPTFIKGSPSSQQVTFDISPPVVTTLFTRATINIQDYELKNNEFFRLRAIKPQDESEILIDQTKNTTYQVYLPKDTIELYIDIIQDRRLNNGAYKIYSVLVTGILILEPVAMTKQKFQFQILPRLQAEVEPQIDISTDYGKIKQHLHEIKTLKRIISSLKDVESQSRYNSLMFNRIQTLFNQTVLNSQQNGGFASLSMDNNALLKSFFLDILANMFIEGCKNLDYQYQVALYYSMINGILVTPQSIKEMSETKIDLEFKLSYSNSMNLLSQTECLNETQRQRFGNFSNEILLASMLEGEIFYYGRDEPRAILYKLSQLDKEADNLLQFATQDNNAFITTRSAVLQQNVSYISYRSLSNLQRPTEFKPGNSYLSSEILLEMNILGDDIQKINPTQNFQTQIDFVIQNAVVNQIALHNKSFGGMSICISKSDNEANFLFSKVDTDLITEDFQRTQGRVRCISKHLSTFAVSYLPIDLQQAAQNLPLIDNNKTLEDDDPLIFESVPLLKYLLPALFVVIILVLAVFGLIMSQMEFNRPKRLYNKLSLTENLEKYNFLRLLACMILQFNPIFNYVFKPNFYLTRPLRLHLLANYFLFVSSFCLLYYTWIPPGIRLADIFWFGFTLMILIGLLRPKLQEYFFKLFYPKTLTNWKTKGNKYRGKMRSPRRNRRDQRQQYSDMDAGIAVQDEIKQQVINLDDDEEMSPKKRSKNRRYRTTLFDEDNNENGEESRKYMENSQRLQESGARLVDESYNREDDGEDQEGRNMTKGDEIINFRDQKNRSRAAIMQTLSAGQQKKIKGEDDSTVKKLFNKLIKNSNENNSNEVEMTEFKKNNSEATKNKGNQIDQQEKDSQKKDTTQQDSSQAENSTDPTHSKKTSGLQYISSFDRQSREILRNSVDSNQQLEAQNHEYAGFKFEKPQVQESPIHIDLDNRNDISAADFDTSKDDLNRDSTVGFKEDYILEQKNKRGNDDDLQHEGGEDEDQEEDINLPKENEQSHQQQENKLEQENTKREDESDENEEGASPEPLRAQSRLQEQQEPVAVEIPDEAEKPQRPRRRKRHQDQIEVGFNNQNRYTADEAQEHNQGSPEGPDNQGGGAEDESTPSLESVYKNYRELKEQVTTLVYWYFMYRAQQV